MIPFVMGYTAGSRTASRAAAFAREVATTNGAQHSNRVEDLGERIDEMAMVLRAMWALLEENGYTADQLMDKIEQLDLADGTADGQVTDSPLDCPSCDSKVAIGLAACQFCGATVRIDDGHPLGGL